MTAARVPEPCKGWLIPDRSITFENLSTTDSAYTQAGPHGGGAGTPVDTSTQAAIEVSGDQDVPIVVRVENGGMPRLSGGVRIGYRKASEAATAERGWETPNVITGAGNAPAYDLATTTARSAMDMIALRTGIVLAVHRAGTTISMQTYNPDTHAWTDSSASAPVAAIADGMCVAQDPADGRIYVICNPGTPSGWSLYRSTAADSVTGGWTLIATDIMPAPTVSAGQKMRLFILPNGDFSLWVIATAYPDMTFDQLASDSKGARFTVIKSATAGSYYHGGDVVQTANGRIGLIAVSASSGDPTWIPIGSAWEPVGLIASGVKITTTDSRDIYAATDPNGRIYVWTRNDVGQSTVMCYYSDDEGATWTAHTYPLMRSEGTDDDPHLTIGKAIHCGGAFYLMSQASDAATTISFVFLKLGGYSNLIQRTTSHSGVADQNRLGSGKGSVDGCSWVATSLPVAQGCWTRTTSAGTEALTTPGRLVLTHGGASSTMYYDSATVPGNNTILAGCSFAVASGGSTVAQGCGVNLITSTGAASGQIQIWASTTAFVIRDDASTLATVTIDMTTPMEFRLYLAPSAVVEVYYKRPQSETWTLAYGSAASHTFGAAASLARWGHVAAVACTSNWDYFWVTTCGGQGQWLSPAAVAPLALGPMTGRLVSSLPVPLGLRAASGKLVTYVRLTDGPGYVGDSWTVPPRYDHGIENLHWQRQPSPRRTWRSTGVGSSDGVIAWETAPAITTTLGRYMGVALLNINFPSAALYAWDPLAGGGAAWVSAGSYAGSTEFASLEWDRVAGSDRITVAATSTAAIRFVQAEEFVGASVNLGGGKIRKIRAHTEGSWSTAAAAGGRTVELWLDGIDDSEGTSGSLDIWPRNGLFVLHPTTRHCRRYKLSIPATTTADGYFEIGNIIIGHWYVPGQQPTWSTVQNYERNASSSESVDLVSRVREKGPPRRSWTWDWSDAVDVINLRSAAVPDWLAPEPTSTDGIAAYQDAPWKIAGILSHTKSGEIPVVACSALPMGTSSWGVGPTITDPTLFLYGRIVSDVGLEMINGDEGASEVMRVSAVTVQGIP